MAEEQGGQPQQSWQAAPWTKLFSAFRIAISPSKLLLAAAGIVTMAVGWWVLAVVFYNLRSMPKGDDLGSENREEGFKRLKAARRSWNLLNEMAGPKALEKDALDVAETVQEFDVIDKVLRASKPVQIVKDDSDNYSVLVGDKTFPFTAEADKLKKMKPGPAPLDAVDVEKKLVTLSGVEVSLPKATVAQVGELTDFLNNVKDAEKYRAQAVTDAAVAKAVKKADNLSAEKQFKPYEQLRQWPWYEYRGP